MSLFESASLVVTPNGTRASKLYAIKPTDGSGDLTVTRATTATRVNSAGLIESVANNVPRLDYLNSTCPSVLVEPQRTNILTYSEQFDNAAWTKTNTTVTANATTAPDGTLSADKIIESANLNTHYLRRLISFSGTNAISIYAKAAERDRIWVGNVSTLEYTIFDLTNGTVVTQIGTFDSQITELENGWYRCTVIDVLNTSAFLAYGIVASGTTLSYLGDGTSGLYLWGAQLEAGSYSTSYIPTTSASVTRNADVINKTGISNLIGQTEGTLFLDTIINNLSTPTNFSVLCYLKGSSELYIEISTSGVITAIFYDGSSSTGSITGSLGFTSGRHKFAFAYKSNDFILYVDGAQFGVDTSGLVSGTLTELGLQYYSNNYLGSQKVNTATLFKTRLTNAELAQLTTI
jgi:hypothetical protein